MSPMSHGGDELGQRRRRPAWRSGILSMSRMVGGTFGVAAIGALFQHLASNQLADELAGTGVSAAQRERIVDNLGLGERRRRLPPAGGRTPRSTRSSTRSRTGCGSPPAWRPRRGDRVLPDRAEDGGARPGAAARGGGRGGGAEPSAIRSRVLRSEFRPGGGPALQPPRGPHASGSAVTCPR